MAAFRAFASPFAHAGANTVAGDTSLVVSGQEEPTRRLGRVLSRADLQLRVDHDALAAREASYAVALRRSRTAAPCTRRRTLLRGRPGQQRRGDRATFVAFADANAAAVSGVASRGDGFQLRFHADGTAAISCLQAR